VGTLGTLALLGACLTPFLHLGCQYLLYQAASLVSAAAGPGKLTKLISMLGDAFALVLAMTGAAAVVLLISLLSSMTALTPG
ncbi:MAG: stage III sporulation protein AE, partial [Oscillospiraceae bacterium]|nr:stage III sporulation protein AE [Oscillospiraceae bacterium]